jgi:hypothetical protein
MKDFMKYGLNSGQTFIGYFVDLTMDGWLFYLMDFKRNPKKRLKTKLTEQ